MSGPQRPTFTISGPGGPPRQPQGQGGNASAGGDFQRELANARDELARAKSQLETSEGELDRLQREPTMIATVVELLPPPSKEPSPSPRDRWRAASSAARPPTPRMLVAFGPGNAVDIEAIDDVKVGDRVRCNRNTMQALSIVRNDETPTGTIVVVTRQTNMIVEGEIMGVPQGFRAVEKTPGSKEYVAYEKGERVVLDPSQRFVIGSLGMPPAQFAFSDDVRVSWDDIGGHAGAKAALREAISLPHQHKALFAAYGKRPVRGVMLEGPTGTGKCLGIGTPILMHDGSVKNVENVIIGDRLMGPDSEPRVVHALGRGQSPLYRVIPTKGESWVCNDEHILTLVGTGPRLNETIDVCVKDFVALAKSERHLWKLWRTGVEFETSKQSVDPYLLGIWLGDGSIDDPTITTMDQEVIDYCRAIALSMGLAISVRDSPSKAKTVSMVLESKTAKGVQGTLLNPLTTAFRSCVRDGEKFIPQEFLVANREQRMALLAGLLDSDGSVSDGGFDIITKSKSLRDGILFLARSLGLAAYNNECIKSIKSIGFTGTYQRIMISGDCSTIPTRVPHKKAPAREQIKRTSVTGFVLEPIGTGDYYGFTLDGDRRFVLGDFTVTHNTLLAKAAATELGNLHGKHAADPTDKSGKITPGAFIYVKGPELLHPYIGRSEEHIRKIFSSARDHFKTHGYPAVVFLDECDAVLAARDSNLNTSLNQTIVPQFLAEMDGLDTHATMIILATNRPDRLDPAVTREGRVDRKIFVGRPTSKDDVSAIVAIHLRNRPRAKSITSGFVAGQLWDDSPIVRELVLHDTKHTLHLKQFLSGAMIEAIIEAAATSALLRDVDARRGHDDVCGIEEEDIKNAIALIARQTAGANPEEVLREAGIA